MTAIQAGFTSVMMDGSLKADAKTPSDWDYNVGVTKLVAHMAHLGSISVEGELGVLGSRETGMGDKEDGHGAEGKLSAPSAAGLSRQSPARDHYGMGGTRLGSARESSATGIRNPSQKQTLLFRQSCFTKPVLPQGEVLRPANKPRCER
jgi:hypothetical protein